MSGAICVDGPSNPRSFACWPTATHTSARPLPLCRCCCCCWVGWHDADWEQCRVVISERTGKVLAVSFRAHDSDQGQWATARGESAQRPQTQPKWGSTKRLRERVADAPGTIQGCVHGTLTSADAPTPCEPPFVAPSLCDCTTAHSIAHLARLASQSASFTTRSAAGPWCTSPPGRTACTAPRTSSCASSGQPTSGWESTSRGTHGRGG